MLIMALFNVYYHIKVRFNPLVNLCFLPYFSTQFVSIIKIFDGWIDIWVTEVLKYIWPKKVLNIIEIDGA